MSIYGGVSTGLLNMTADVYIQQNEQDSATGAVKRTWAFFKKVQCHVDIINSQGASTPDNDKVFGKEYVQEEKIRLKTSEQLSKRMRITNIRNRSDRVLFLEFDQVDTPPTIFEIDSHHPRLDPLGNVLYFESNLRRLGVQSNDY
jgi:hypothetical protein